MEQNLPLATADNLTKAVKVMFPDSRIAASKSNHLNFLIIKKQMNYYYYFFFSLNVYLLGNSWYLV